MSVYQDLIEERLYNKNNRSKKAFSALLTVIGFFLAAIIVFRIVFSVIYQPIKVQGNSMLETLHSGDIIYSNKFVKAERGDIVIIDVSAYPEKGFSGTLIVKRLIATEGDSVFCSDGVVYLKKSGENEYVALDEPYASTKTSDFAEVTVPEGGIFFLGDNREVSYDSRGQKAGKEAVGCLKEEDIYGVVNIWWSQNAHLFGDLIPS